MKILITGGLGFIGSHLGDFLSKKYEVTIVDKLSKRVHPYEEFVYKPKNCRIIKKDINDKSFLKKILPNYDYIYHLASHQDHLKDYSMFINENVSSTSLIFEVLNELKNLKLKQFILASSQSVYGDGQYTFKKKKYSGNRKLENLVKKKWSVKHKSEKFIKHREKDNLIPINFYGLSKVFQEEIVKQCSKELGIKYTIMRYSIVQGPRQSFFNSYSGLCRNLISSYIKGEKPVIFEDGLSTRDFINIHDVINANQKVLNNKKAYNETFNIGGGKIYSLVEFDKIVRKKLNVNIKPIINRYFRVNDPRNTISNIEKAKKILNWQPKKDVDESISAYIEWVLKSKKALKFSKNGLDNMIKDGSVIDCN